MTTAAALKRTEQAEALARLRDWLKPGDTVYTILRHRSASGMSRSISCVGIGPDTDGERRIFDYDYNVARALGYSIDRDRAGVKVSGAGMDMGFHIVYNLSRILFPDGYGCTGAGCHSNDHSNGDRDYTPHKDEGERIGADGTLCTCHATHWHRDGGYALSQRWL